MNLYVKSPLIASLSMIFEAETDCGAGLYIWSYKFRGETFPLCDSTNPRASCSGNVIETHPGAFFANSTIIIRVEFFVDNLVDTSLNPLVEKTIKLEEEEMNIFLFYGSTNNSLFLESSFENNNFYENYYFVWSCFSLDEENCPSCPSQNTTQEIVYYFSETTPNFIINFNQEFENACSYIIGVEVVFSTKSKIKTTREALILGEGREVPIIRFDDVLSSCSRQDDNGEVYLVLEPVEGLGEGDEVVDYVWEQVKGDEVRCTESSTRNCGGNGNSFLYIPQENLLPCEIYAWEATVIIGTRNGDVFNVSLPLCDVSFFPPPSNGTCFLVSDSDIDNDCDLPPLSVAIIQCEGWQGGCKEGESPSLTTQLFRISEADSTTFIPLDSPSITMQNEFYVSDENERIIIQICNDAVCIYTDPIFISICEENEEQREENLQNILENAQEEINNNQLESALQSLLVVSDSLEECEDYFDEVIKLTNEYITANLASVEGNATNLQDTTVLMELLGTIGSRSCSTPVELFESLLMLCNATTTANVQTFALDELFQTIINNVETDNERIIALDYALQVNDCVQASSLSDRCSNRLPTLYSGDSFYFSQNIFTMQQFEDEEQRIDIPNATVIFPRGFDKQIARDYTLSSGDEIIRFSCVAINMIRTDTILTTDITIDSAIVGMTAMVYVNGSAYTIELGHQGEPVIGVILRIYRQTERESNKRNEKEIEKNKKRYVERVNLGDDCDESISCSYYEGEGLLSTTGCITVDVTDEYVDCSCDHYSNFGLLFSSCDNEKWTIWRILTLSFLCSMWFFLILLGSLVKFSPTFRIWAHLETSAEKRIRVMGSMTE